MFDQQANIIFKVGKSFKSFLYEGSFPCDLRALPQLEGANVAYMMVHSNEYM